MKKPIKLKNRENKYDTFNTLLIILGIVCIVMILLGLYYFLGKKTSDKQQDPSLSSSKPKKALKMGESLADISWNVKINDDKLKGKAEPFKIIFDTDKTGHIQANQKTLDFLFGGKKTFTYTYQGQGTDLYHLIINNERWQLSFTRVNDVLDENLTSFANMDRPSGIVMLHTERAD